MKILSVLTEKKTMISQVEKKNAEELNMNLKGNSYFQIRGNENQLWPSLSRSHRTNTSELYLFSEFLTRHERTILCSRVPASMLYSVSACSVINPQLFTQSLSPVYREPPLSYCSITERNPPALCGLQPDLGLESCPSSRPGKCGQVVSALPHVPEGQGPSRHQKTITYYCDIIV